MAKAATVVISVVVVFIGGLLRKSFWGEAGRFGVRVAFVPIDRAGPTKTPRRTRKFRGLGVCSRRVQARVVEKDALLRLRETTPGQSRFFLLTLLPD
jgi:hypothetical protein